MEKGERSDRFPSFPLRVHFAFDHCSQTFAKVTRDNGKHHKYVRTTTIQPTGHQPSP